MDDFEPRSWQARWSGLADRLEIALENTFYRTCLCAASIALVLLYAFFATRFAQPSRWVSNSLITIDSEGGPDIDFLKVDEINRSIVRLQKLASVLQIRPTLLMIKSDQVDLERHVLRLWLDEIRGQNFEGMYDVVSEVLVRAILVVVFERDEASSEASTNWYSQLKSFRETCGDQDILTAHPQWRGLCGAVSSKIKSDFDRPNPLSLSKWLSGQVVAEAKSYGPTQRIGYLRGLVKQLARPTLARFERLDAWPKKAADFGPTLKELVTILAPTQAGLVDFSPRIYWIKMSVENGIVDDSKEAVGGPATDLVVLTSCVAPTLKSIIGQRRLNEAKEVLWAKTCDQKRVLVEARTSAEFAERNPEAAFVQIGMREIEMALTRGWLKETATVVEVLKSSNRDKPIDSRDQFSSLIRSQQTDWNATAKAYRLRSPVEVVKLVRIDSAMKRDL